MDAERIRFLYRTEEGRIDRATWRRGAGALLAILAPLTLIWLALSPYAAHDLAQRPLFAPETAAAYFYVLFYAFAVLLLAISFVNLSAKRFRDRGRTPPLGLASLAPLLALLSGAAHFLQPRVAEVMSRWYVWGVDAALVAAIVWTVYELGWRDN
ncbi:hypothetical protein V3H18_07680 [Methylocystis sp. 9N]|uniref:DUF805 domain-containing protein n=1 Tax=Methylocystis borbori TaxID=3118750 RepID=A0ABU7XH97_9HYPH